MEALIQQVIKEIEKDINKGNTNVLKTLLSLVPRECLVAFLPNSERERFENEYSCDNCGSGFAKEEMDFDVDDQDLCKNCSHKSFNDAPYGDD